jgi:hypothetical protein
MAPGGSFSDGPFEMAYDAYNGIVYSANWGNGLLALPLRQSLRAWRWHIGGAP